MTSDALDQALLDAHRRGALPDLVALYTQAGDKAEAANDIEAASFFLTHAFVYALELGAPEAAALNTRLVARGRAHPLETT